MACLCLSSSSSGRPLGSPLVAFAVGSPSSAFPAPSAAPAAGSSFPAATVLGPSSTPAPASAGLLSSTAPLSAIFPPSTAVLGLFPLTPTSTVFSPSMAALTSAPTVAPSSLASTPPTHFPGDSQSSGAFATVPPPPIALGTFPLPSHAPHLSALTNVTTPYPPGAVVAGQNECTRAGGAPPLGTWGATPGVPPPGGRTRGRVASSLPLSDSAPLNAPLSVASSASQSMIPSASQPHLLLLLAYPPPVACLNMFFIVHFFAL